MSQHLSDPEWVLEGLKARADHLIKDFRKADQDLAIQAGERLLQHPRIAQFGPAQELWQLHKDQVRRKHALDVVAIELGWESWRGLMDDAKRRCPPAVAEPPEPICHDAP